MRYGLSRRRVTVSTSGVVPMMDRLAEDCPVALAVSLHAPNDPLRDSLVPLNRKYPMAELLDACLRYLPAAPRDFITFEYCMLDGVNDQPEHARELLQLLRSHGDRGVPCKINLIPFNPFPDSGLTCSPRPVVQQFARLLSEGGLITTVRKTRGDDIDAACGQLAGDVLDRTRAASRMAQRRAGHRTPDPICSCQQEKNRHEPFHRCRTVATRLVPRPAPVGAGLAGRAPDAVGAGSFRAVPPRAPVAHRRLPSRSRLSTSPKSASARASGWNWRPTISSRARPP